MVSSEMRIGHYEHCLRDHLDAIFFHYGQQAQSRPAVFLRTALPIGNEILAHVQVAGENRFLCYLMFDYNTNTAWNAN